MPQFLSATRIAFVAASILSTEGESFSVGDGENSPAENADVSMIDRCLDDAVVNIHLLL